MKNYSLGMLKPDAIERDIQNNIYEIIELNGLKIIFKEKVNFSPIDVELFYEESIYQPYFNDIVKYITRGIVEIFIVEGKNSVDELNKIVGLTDPKLAEEGTLRSMFGKNILENTIHSSNENRVDIEIEHVSRKIKRDIFNILSLNNE